jgi:Lipase (class 3)
MTRTKSSNSQLFILPSLLNTENKNNSNGGGERKNNRGDSNNNDDDDDTVTIKCNNMASSNVENSDNDDNNNNNQDDDIQGQSKDFSAWVEGLTQWPRYPSSSGSTSTSVTRSVTSGGGELDTAKTNATQDSNISNEESESSVKSNLRNNTFVETTTPVAGDRPSTRLTATGTTTTAAKTKAVNEALTMSSFSSPSTTRLSRYRGINPLSNFIKFEAILDLASSVSNETEPYFTNVFAAADRLFQLAKQQAQEQEGQIGVLEALEFDELDTNAESGGTTTEKTTTDIMTNVTTVEDLIRREQYFGSLPFIVDPTVRKDITKDRPSNQVGIAQAAESLLKDTTARIEYLVNEASSALSPGSVQDLIVRASKVFESSALSTNDTDAINNRIEAVSNDIFQAVQRITRDGVVDTQFATDLAQEALNLAAVANIVLGAGYAYGSRSGATGMEGTNPLLGDVLQGQQQQLQQASNGSLGSDSPMLQPLFVDFKSAERIEPFEYDRTLLKGAEMGVLAGAIYEETSLRCKKIGHSLVANGTTANVAWMVTDSIDFESRFVDPSDIDGGSGSNKPVLTRTITIRGFDASDDTVDREKILNEICTATPEPLNDEISGVLLHSGLLAVARQIYADTKQYIDWMAPNHRLVLNGHSIGGSLSILILLIIATEEGLDFVFDRILRVYTHGSPPIAAMVERKDTSSTAKHSCSILDAFGLPADIVYNYIQPVRCDGAWIEE